MWHDIEGPVVVHAFRDDEVQDLHAQLSASHQSAAAAQALLAQAQAPPGPEAQAEAAAAAAVAAAEMQQLRSAASHAEEEVMQLRASLAGREEELHELRAAAASEQVAFQAEARAAQAMQAEQQAALAEAQAAAAQVSEALAARGAELAGLQGELELVQHKLCAAVKKGKVGVPCCCAMLLCLTCNSGTMLAWPALHGQQCTQHSLSRCTHACTLLLQQEKCCFIQGSHIVGCKLTQGIEYDKAAVVLERDALQLQLQGLLAQAEEQAARREELQQAQLHLQAQIVSLTEDKHSAQMFQHAEQLQHRLLELEADTAAVKEAAAQKVRHMKHATRRGRT